MKKIIAMTAASAMLLTSFAACGKDKDSGCDFEGKWAASEMVVDGQSMTSMPMLVAQIPLDALYHMEIKDGGELTVSTGLTGLDDDGDSTAVAATGKWEKVDSDTIKVTEMKSTGDDEDTAGEFEDMFKDGLELNFEDDTFQFEAESEGKTAVIKFKKVTEFPTFDASSLMSDLANAFGSSATTNNN